MQPREGHFLQRRHEKLVADDAQPEKRVEQPEEVEQDRPTAALRRGEEVDRVLGACVWRSDCGSQTDSGNDDASGPTVGGKQTRGEGRGRSVCVRALWTLLNAEIIV